MAIFPFLEGLTISLENFLISMVVNVILLIILIVFLYNTFHWAPEHRIIAKCRRKDLPMLDIVDPSGGNSEIEVGSKKKPGAPVFEHEEHGVKIDPSFSGNSAPERWQRGLVLHHFSKNYPFAISERNARARIAIRDYVRKSEDYKNLTYLTDEELMTLIGTNREKLGGIARLFIDKYYVELTKDELFAGIEQEKISEKVSERLTNELMDQIKDIQDETSKLPVMTGHFSWAEAFKLIPSAFLSQDLHSIILYTERMTDLKNKGLFNIMTYAIAGAIVIGAIGVAVYAIGTVK